MNTFQWVCFWMLAIIVAAIHGHYDGGWKWPRKGQ